jgi:hypothetical protein
MHFTFILYNDLRLGIGLKLAIGKIVTLKSAFMMTDTTHTHRLVISTSRLPASTIRITVSGPRSACLDIASYRGRILGLSSIFCFRNVTHLPYRLSIMGSLF